MSITSAILDKILKDLGITKEDIAEAQQRVQTIAKLFDHVDITEDHDSINIQINPRKINITVSK